VLSKAQTKEVRSGSLSSVFKITNYFETLL